MKRLAVLALLPASLAPAHAAEPVRFIEPVASVAAFVHALPPCPMEDSDRCYWDATTRGNGRGTSFVALNGHIVPIGAPS